ncbi:MAG: FAD binding domain-containing protein [Hyphomicrobiaceae bacterium]
MKALDFDYVRPATLDAALQELENTDANARAIAGGQSLVAMMNFRLAQPERLVDLSDIAALRFVRDIGDAIEIGAMTTFADLERSELVGEHFPLLRAALPHIAHPSIRSRGTIGGSAALADPAAEVPALLLAANARLNIVSTAGSRTMDAHNFIVGTYETALKASELLRSITIPKPPANARFAFCELARRHGDYAMVGVAMAADSVVPITNLRVVLFAIGDTAMRAAAAEAAMDGTAREDAGARETALAALEELDFRADLNAGVDTKRHLSRVILKRAFAELTE